MRSATCVFGGRRISATVCLPQTTRRAIAMAATKGNCRSSLLTQWSNSPVRPVIQIPLAVSVSITRTQVRSMVWHSGFLDDQIAKDIGKKIHILQLEERLRATHSDLLPNSPAALREREEQIAALQEDYCKLTGEPWDDDNDPTVKRAAFQEDYEDKETKAQPKTVSSTTQLSDLELLEVEMRLLEEDIQHLKGADETNGSRVQSLRERVEGLQDEYETMVEAEHKRTTKTMIIELD